MIEIENKKIKNLLVLLVGLFIPTVIIFTGFFMMNFDHNKEELKYTNGEKIKLPNPSKDGDVSLEEVLNQRRSVREFKKEALSISEISQLLWAAQGITEKETSFRTAPSAGATYPLEVYIAVKKAEELDPGLYLFLPQENALVKKAEGDLSEKIASAGLNQKAIKDAPVNILFSAFYDRTTKIYGEKGERYVHMEAGHAAQNVYLQGEAIGIGLVVIGAFKEEELREVLNLKEEETPLYIIPAGLKK